MFYEERTIRGVKMYRTSPRGNWRVLSKDLNAVIGAVVLGL